MFPTRLEFTRDQLVQALAINGGRLVDAARDLGCSHDTVKRRIAEERAEGRDVPLTLGRLVRTDASRARESIVDALEATEGNRTEAATMLGASVVTLWRACKALGIAEEITRRWPQRGVHSAEHLAKLRANARHARDSITEWTRTPGRVDAVRKNLATARAVRAADVKRRAKKRARKGLRRKA